MATGPAIRYVQYYTDGSAARKAQPTVQLQMELKPKAKKRKKILVRIDPVATLGILVAAVMLIMMISGMVRLHGVRRQEQRMEAYVQQLQQENAKLEEQYHAGYDPEEIYEMATAMGMIPADQAQHIQVQVTLQEPEAEPSGWENFCKFLAGLFA